MNYKLNLATTHPEIATELSPDSPVPAEEISASYNKKLPWICPRGHHWETSPYNRQRGQLCPYCSDRKVLIGFNDLATTHPDIANQLTDTDLALTITKKSSKKVEWSCDLGHVWKTSVSHRVKGTGCPYCSGRKVLAGFNDLATTHPDLAKELVNPEIATTLSAYSGKPVEWVCELGHVWETKVATRQRSGCPYCSNRKLLPGFNDLATTHPELAKELVDPEIATTVFAGSHDKVDWVCSRGHVWNASIVHRRNRSGCPYCTNRKILVGFNDLSTTHPEVAKELTTPEDGHKITSGSGELVNWTCSRFSHHTWDGSAISRIQGEGCPYCANKRIIAGFNDLATTHPEIAKEMVTLELATTLSFGSDTRTEWKCDRGHTWSALLTSSPRLKPGDSWELAFPGSCFIDGCLPALGAGRSHTISAG